MQKSDTQKAPMPWRLRLNLQKKLLSLYQGKSKNTAYMQDISGNDSCDKLNFWLRNTV